MYSYGVILYELLTREVPWNGMPQESLPHLVGELHRRPENIPKDLDKNLSALKLLMEDCWKQEPTKR